MKLLLILFLAAPAMAQNSYVVEDLEKEGQIQAYKLNFDKKFDVSGGTITGKAYLSTTTVLNLTATSLSATSVSITTTTISSSTITNLSVTSDFYFTGATSTAAFSGWIDIGAERVVNDCGSAANCTATCTTGNRVTGGGCEYNVNVFGTGYPNSDTTYYCAISNTQQLTAYAICARVK